LVGDQTQWVDLHSPSRQKHYATPIGGFTGQATYTSEHWEQLLPWLLWGQVTQVGKNTVKGNGWYEVA
ncbi:MAG: CRISPR system precrRNA processing endoribonuclease RAMP protein Cas6, partial [Anaerolineae bacterium]